MSAERQDICIASLVRQIDENNDRIGTLEAENARLTRELAAARTQREDFAAKVFHATRRGW